MSFIDQQTATLLNNIQNNILISHGREHSRYFFIRFDDNTPSNFIRYKISRNSGYITTALDQHNNYIAYKAYKNSKNELYKFKNQLVVIAKDKDATSKLFENTIVLVEESIQNLVKTFRSEEATIDFKMWRDKFDWEFLDWAKKYWREKIEKFIKNHLNKLQKESAHEKGVFNESAFKKAIKNYFESAVRYKMKYKEEVMVSFCLSSSGYKKLSLDNKYFPKDTSFVRGMKNYQSQNILNDSIEKNWDSNFQKEIDAVVIVAHENRSRLEKSTEILKNILKDGGQILFHEEGKKLYKKVNGKLIGIEHFGYPDGLSQPGFIKSKYPKKIELIEENLKLVLVKEQLFKDKINRLRELESNIGLTKEEKEKLEELENAFGSYLVFRKLEQNVKQFNSKVRTLAEKMQIFKIKTEIAKITEVKENATIGEIKELIEKVKNKSRVNQEISKENSILIEEIKKLENFENSEHGKKLIELAEAQLMGRYKNDATPIVLSKLDDKYKNHKEKLIKEFNNYDGEDHNPSTFKKFAEYGGRVCPFHAHIRKANPRSTDKKIRFQNIYESTDFYGVKGLEVEKNNVEARIVRRGYTYDYLEKGRHHDLNDEPENDVGLLFISYQASIKGQFEKISGWCNSPSFPPKSITNQNFDVGLDPIIGQLSKQNKDECKQFWDEDNGNEKTPFLFGNVVKPKGGEYFFAPSITFLKKLKNF